MFKVDELLRATKGRLISGNADTVLKGISIDSRSIGKQEAFIALKGNNFDGHDFITRAIKKGASCILCQRLSIRFPSKEIAFIKVKDTTKALGDIARFQRKKFDIPVIAVTGSNGKTTTKEMVAWVMSWKFKVLKNIGTKNNHIGLPLTLLNLDSSYDFAVLELGTNHFGEVSYLAKICLPNIGIITNIGPAHLEYFKNLQGVFKEKYTLLKHLHFPHVAILNADDSLLKREILRVKNKGIVFGIGIKNGSDFFASKINNLSGRLEFLVNEKYKFTLNTLGYYNIHNAFVVIALARLFGMEYKDIARRLAAFDFPQGRLKLIKLNKIHFIDDTYNANPVSLEQALEVLGNFRIKGRKIIVMGDMLELGEEKELFHYKAGQEAARICDIFIGVGKLSKLAADAAKTQGFDVSNIFRCKDSLEARDILFNKISPGKDDVVLVKGSRLMRMEEVFKI